MYLATESLSGGELYTAMAVHEDGLPEPSCARLTREMCAGVEHLHSKSIVHRDLKPDNLMVTRAEANRKPGTARVSGLDGAFLRALAFKLSAACLSMLQPRLTRQSRSSTLVLRATSRPTAAQ